MLYSTLAPKGEETTIVPVGVMQSGCTVTLAEAGKGTPKTGFITPVSGAEVQLDVVLRTKI